MDLAFEAQRAADAFDPQAGNHQGAAMLAGKHNVTRQSNPCAYRQKHGYEKHGDGGARTGTLSYVNGFAARVIDRFAVAIHGSAPLMLIHREPSDPPIYL
jgi:hypothetical protein